MIALLAVAGVSFLLLAPVYQYPITKASSTNPIAQDMRPFVMVSPSFNYLGFGGVSENLCGHNGYFFQWNWNVNFDC